ncbi:MAG: glycosyltransferase [Chloroflexota bacterium]
MVTAREVQVPPLSLDRMRVLIDAADWERLEVGLDLGRALLAERQLWNVNSTAAGGGVAEMLWSWVGLARGLDIAMRWLTISGAPDFFTVTKRLHNRLHGEDGDAGELGERERAVYEEVTRANAEDVLEAVGPRDVMFLHDPQTAGLIPHLAGSGRTVVWRCHIGADETNELSRSAWDFLAPYVTKADACVFSREAYVPEVCRESGVPIAIVPPSIDGLSPKNQEMTPPQVEAILRHTGLLAEDRRDGAEAIFIRPEGGTTRVERRCELISEGFLPEPETPLVVQVSRWDQLKDPIGAMQGFADAIPGDAAPHLILAGPSLGSVADDPDGVAVLGETEEAWRRLDPRVRRRVHLACLPMEDLEENAAIVNALQRQASVVVQKSLKEGFGLTVTEAMWKARPVVASATGGIRDQIVDGVTGVLLPNPFDLDAYGAAVTGLLEEPERARRIGEAAHASVRANFLENRHTLQYVELLGRLLAT